MAQPDNVARVIAFCSAAFTAGNVSVAIAAFRRKRPTVKVRSPGLFLTRAEAGPAASADRDIPHFGAVLKTRSEVDVRIDSVVVLFYAYQWVIIRTRRVPRGTRVRELRYVGTYPLRTQDGEQITLEAFGRRSLKWLLVPPPGTGKPVHPAMARLRASLSNGQTVTSKRFPVSPQAFPCRCFQCSSSGTQLTFDDLTE
ncbi:hypothetical protein G3I40_09445 [Streptomyces sp. SID14478]|uniref:hypothetical protein n=1 Tax=Streptomyces sp. SID14478 TaxID=2706073 RepID=UPI0013DA9B6B|nr:hypothetical protein [Streptomyces sp. SID14478]NEB75447.1 hypothetical protein [Streptomyces sp. SID14478]